MSRVEYINIVIRPDFEVNGQAWPVKVKFPILLDREFESTQAYYNYLDSCIQEYFPWTLSWDFDN